MFSYTRSPSGVVVGLYEVAVVVGRSVGRQTEYRDCMVLMTTALTTTTIMVIVGAGSTTNAAAVQLWCYGCVVVWLGGDDDDGCGGDGEGYDGGRFSTFKQ